MLSGISALRLTRFRRLTYKYDLAPSWIVSYLVPTATNMTISDNSNVVILPYYCDAEIARYLTIASCLYQLGSGKTDFAFLLAASPKIPICSRLHNAYSRIAPTTSFQCPTKVFGYPQGPTAMFWDCMDYVADEMNGRPGFSLWFESDMTVVKPNWMDRLNDEWLSTHRGGSKLVMGNVVPDVYRHRLFRRRKRLLTAHVNGGACYAKDFARRMPAEARQGVFDMTIYQFAMAADGIQHTDQICFSTLERVHRDAADPIKVILHGYMQDKDLFVERCRTAVTQGQPRLSIFDPLAQRFETFRRRVRVRFVKRGPRAMLENVLLSQDRSRSRRTA